MPSAEPSSTRSPEGTSGRSPVTTSRITAASFSAGMTTATSAFGVSFIPPALRLVPRAKGHGRPERRSNRTIALLSGCSGLVPLVSSTNAIRQPDPWSPTEGRQSRGVQELPRRPVRLGGIPGCLAAIAHDLGDDLGKLSDRHVVAHADVDGLGRSRSRRSRCSTASARSSTCRNSRRGSPVPHSVTGPPVDLRLVELADHRRQHVRGVEVEVVARPVQVGRHGRDPAPAVLAAGRT